MNLTKYLIDLLTLLLPFFDAITTPPRHLSGAALPVSNTFRVQWHRVRTGLAAISHERDTATFVTLLKMWDGFWLGLGENRAIKCQEVLAFWPECGWVHCPLYGSRGKQLGREMSRCVGCGEVSMGLTVISHDLTLDPQIYYCSVNCQVMFVTRYTLVRFKYLTRSRHLGIGGEGIMQADATGTREQLWRRASPHSSLLPPRQSCIISESLM